MNIVYDKPLNGVVRWALGFDINRFRVAPTSSALIVAPKSATLPLTAWAQSSAKLICDAVAPPLKSLPVVRLMMTA